MDERLKQQQRRQRLERTRRVGKAGLWQTAKDQTGLYQVTDQILKEHIRKGNLKE